MTTIKPCPFCGSSSAPELAHVEGDVVVACYGSRRGCGARSGGVDSSDPDCEAEAIGTWNLRATPDEATRQLISQAREDGRAQGRREGLLEAIAAVEDTDVVEAKGGSYYAQLGDAAATRRACADAIRTLAATPNKSPTPTAPPEGTQAPDAPAVEGPAGFELCSCGCAKRLHRERTVAGRRVFEECRGSFCGRQSYGLADAGKPAPAPAVPTQGEGGGAPERRELLATMLEDCAAAVRERFEGGAAENTALGLVLFAEGIRQRRMVTFGAAAPPPEARTWAQCNHIGPFSEGPAAEPQDRERNQLYNAGFEFGLKTGRKQERADVVAWLEDGCGEAARNLASWIKAGDHEGAAAQGGSKP